MHAAVSYFLDPDTRTRDGAPALRQRKPQTAAIRILTRFLPFGQDNASDIPGPRPKPTFAVQRRRPSRAWAAARFDKGEIATLRGCEAARLRVKGSCNFGLRSSCEIQVRVSCRSRHEGRRSRRAPAGDRRSIPRPTRSRAAAAVVRDVPGSREPLGIGELKEMLRI